jgi:hypothetical protein
MNTKSLNTESLISIQTRFGAIEYNPKDVYTFEEGLAGFKNNTLYVRGSVPGMEGNAAYGLLQSLDQADLTFILFYPELCDTQTALITQRIRAITKGDMRGDAKEIRILRGECQAAFLVISNPNEQGKCDVSCVASAPIVFLPSQQKAWQILLG